MGEVGGSDRQEQRLGIAFGTFAYGLWGLFPLYWPLLEPAQAGEILAQRMAWSLLAMLVILCFRRVPAGASGRWGWIRELLREPRRLGLLAAAACLITVNWFTYIWAVNHGHVIDGSLGYFINPLVTVLFGVLLLQEKLRRLQWTAVGIGGAAVLVLALGYGRVPWIALVLASSFGTYGLLKKLAGVPAAESMAVETSLLFIPAVGYLVWLGTQGTLAFGHHGAGNTALLVLTGPVTVIPLIAFAASANRLPLTLLGMLQFLAPVLQFLCGVLVQHEQVPAARLAGFLIVWVALGVLTYDGLRSSKNARDARRERLPVETGAAPAEATA